MAGAKKIAATYCVVHLAQCQTDARVRGRADEIGKEWVMALAAGEGVRFGDTAGVCSFSPDTPILMEGGKTKPIGKVKPGDKVEAGDQKTGKHAGAHEVQHVWINHDRALLDLTVRTKNGRTATLHTTANHPFWNDTTHTWVPAGKLHQGDALNTPADNHAYVVGTHPTPGTAKRWNLTIQQHHTYYVLAGDTPVLVHNSGGCVLTNEQGLAAADAAAGEFAKPGNMSGTLYLEGHDDPISLSSGSGNLSEEYVRPPGASTSNFHHLEAQAAAKMRSTGIMDGHLFISGDYICGACADRLSQMLPEGATLRVTYRDGDGSIQSQLFTGSSG